MAGAGLRFLFVVLLLLHVAAFGAPAPSGTGEAHEEKPPAKDDSASKPSLDSSTLIRSSESMQPQSGAASLDSPPKSDHTGAKESKKAKNLDLPASNSLVSNPDPNDPKQSVNLQTKSKSADVLDSSPQKSDPEDIENLPPATESSQPHTSVSDSSAHKPDLNEAKQSGSLPLGSKGVQSVASVPDSTSRQSNPKENKETKNLSPSTENDHSGATVPESSPQNSDHNKANQNEKLPEESKTVQSDVDPSSRKADHNEDNQSENVPKKSKNPQSEVSVAEPPFPKSGQASQNEKNPHSGAAGAEPTPPKSDHNEANEKDNVPAVAENSIPDNSVPKDDDVDDDSMVDDETIGGGKEGEETAETSQSDKEEAKNSPVGPSPKNGSENSHFFAYLVTTAIVVAALYIAYHNKRKIIAFALEGKKSKVIRRPKSSDYQRLDQKI